MSKDFVKEAEQNVVNQAVFFRDLLHVMDFFNRVGNYYFPNFQTRDREDYFNGLHMMRNALQSQYINKQSNLLGFMAIGGEEAKAFSLNEFRSMFGENAKDRYTVMHFLEKHGGIPNRWKTEDEKLFRDQLAEKLKDED